MLIESWSGTGCASRRMNGVQFHYNSQTKDLELDIISGINCNKKLVNGPIHSKITTINADLEITSEEDSD